MVVKSSTNIGLAEAATSGCSVSMGICGLSYFLGCRGDIFMHITFGEGGEDSRIDTTGM